MSRQNTRSAFEETLEFNRNIESIVNTKSRIVNKKIVATFDNPIAIKIKENSKKTLSRPLELYHDKRRKESLQRQWNNVVT